MENFRSGSCSRNGLEYEKCFQDHSSCLKQRLVDNFRSLLEDKANINGIWLTELIDKYKLKFGYILTLKKYGYSDVMELVTSFPSVFYLKQYRPEGDHLLLDARKFKRDESAKEGEISKSLLRELKILLKVNKQISTLKLKEEYEKMYLKPLEFENLGFQTLDEFIQHLKDTCHELTFRTVVNRTFIKLNYAPVTITSKRNPRYEALPGVIKYDPFPSDVCNSESKLETDPFLEQVKEGDTFKVNVCDVYSPGKFYITHQSKIKLHEKMTDHLNYFYDCYGEKYKMLLPLIQKDLLCACVYSTTSEWHRLRVMSVSSGKAKILWVDYGTVDEVNLEKLHYLHKDFVQYPEFCMRAKLSNIQPKKGKSYDDEANLKFFYMTNNVEAEAKVLHCDPEYLEIDLYVYDSGNRIAVQEELIKKGYVNMEKPISIPNADKTFCSKNEQSQEATEDVNIGSKESSNQNAAANFASNDFEVFPIGCKKEAVDNFVSSKMIHQPSEFNNVPSMW